MTTTQAGWPTQIMLPGQAAAPDGPVDMANMYLFHHAFRRDLDRFLDAVPGTSTDDLGAWRRLTARWHVFARQLHHHHEAEDRVLWPWLRGRVGPDDLEVLDAMEREHSAIDPGLASVATTLETLSAGGGGDREDLRAALTVRLTGVRGVLDQHLAHEETAAIAMLQAVTSQEEWLALEKQFGQGQPVRAVLEMLPWAVDGVDAQVLGQILRTAPLPMRVMLKVLRPGFDRRERAAFPATPGGRRSDAPAGA
jgi:hypothetical protein